ncbi:MAG: quinoprotein dehydrogenase-associated putative ABC transporter substrate-binding protein [Methylococcaceae bacterium]|nr:quinoprotein dehydrogenase-associated putative ABC transporter substrate-binding protein [Methylococcaceae bacterium]MCI0668408.1 quinoprotein dehydrogenase-associated putative ABC transporter substrate-binding protein [Methylococcaceae bacterium]
MPDYLNSRWLVATGLLIGLSGSLPTHAEEAFRVCADPRNPPFSNQQLEGFENQIAAMFAEELGQSVEYTWFPQRIGFIRNTLKAKLPDQDIYKCDVVMGIPAESDMTLTTTAYYRSIYGMIFPKGHKLDDIKTPADMTLLAPERRNELKIAMFDRGPGTDWIVKNGFIEQGVPYQSMTGDPDNNTATTMDRDFKAGSIDLAILWGPMAGYLISNSPPGTYTFLPMISTSGMKFDYSMAMGVRYGDKERQARLDELISKKSDEILEILKKHNVPLVDPEGHLIFVPGN